jgi:DNA-binding LacI/PurR family transcriptional regulator
MIGYRSALDAAGIEADPDLVLGCAAGGIAGAHKIVMEKLPALKPRPTAILVYNDHWTIGVLRALHELGLRVPADISLVGYDDMEFSRFLTPPLSTVAQDPYEIGRQGTELLIERLCNTAEPLTPRQVILKPQLRIRESTAPPGMTHD